MRGISLLFILFIISISPIRAQKIRHGFRNLKPNTIRIAHLQTRIMEKRMHLNSRQTGQVNAINTEYLNQITHLQQNSELNREEKIKQLNQIRGSKMTALKQVLDDNQFQAYLKLHQELQDQRAKRIQDQNQEEVDNTSEE